MKRLGAIPDFVIGEMIAAGMISSSFDNINPASLDLSISGEVYRLNGIFLPRAGEKIGELVSSLDKMVHDLKHPFEKDVIYIGRLNEKLSLPRGEYGYCNPKSSTGRTDVHVRVLADGVSRYDAATRGGSSELWIVVSPKSFPVIIPEGERLAQLRLFNRNTRFDEMELQISFKKDRILWYGGEALGYDDVFIRDGDGSIVLTVDLSRNVAGFECRGVNKILDFSKRGFYPPADFFEKLKPKNRSLLLRRGSFYILSTREAVRVPPHLACEMVPMDERSGDFRSHYAGYIDPGWGWGKKGEGRGRPLTLEVRPFEDVLIRDNQPIAKIRFERMAETPEKPYDEGGTYTDQWTARLSKHFRRD